MELAVVPATRERWEDLANLFRGAPASGCWCMYFRLRREEYGANIRGRSGTTNKEAMRRVIEAGKEPGLLAYAGETPVGWCSVGPREEYEYLQQSKALFPVDDTPVWSIVCFFVRAGWRGKGIAKVLLDASIRYAREHGARVVEAYPSDPAKGKDGRLAEISAYTGVLPMYEALGFVKVAQRRKGGRTIMRLALQPRSRRAEERKPARRRSG